MEHIYECEHIKSSQQPDIKYENIFKGSLREDVQVFKLFREKLSILNIKQSLPTLPTVAEAVFVEDKL